MVFQTLYQTSSKPFNHDKSREKWESPMDFFFACIGHGFKVDSVFSMFSIIIRMYGIYGIISYFILLVTCVIPIIFIQSFLGQFSSTGFISAFRISPLFKGIGYLSLAVNLTTLSYFSFFAALPVFYLFHSLESPLPWSCERAYVWMKFIENATSPCPPRPWSSPIEHSVSPQITQIPSIEFFRGNLRTKDATDHSDGNFAWEFLAAILLIWAIVATVLCTPLLWIGRFLRYSFLLFILLMAVCLIRFALLPNAFNDAELFIWPKKDIGGILIIAPCIAVSALSPGWGSLLTMASFNDFKTDIFKCSWLLGLAQFGVTSGLAFMSLFITSNLRSMLDVEIVKEMWLFLFPFCRLDRHNLDTMDYNNFFTQWMDLMAAPFAFTCIEVPHVWTVIFLVMITLGSLNLLIVQLLSVLTSLFDEFEKLRRFKKLVTLGTVGVLTVVSLYFCLNFQVTVFELLTQFSLVPQTILNFLLLLVVFWIYGRERFQRDLKYMIGRTLPIWMVDTSRFVTPICLLVGSILSLLFTLVFGYYKEYYIPSTVMTVVICSLLPTVLIPGYCIFKFIKTRGVLKERLKRSIKPTDWYPREPLERKNYEENFGHFQNSNQLATITIEF